jgi:hypothetical protein
MFDPGLGLKVHEHLASLGLALESISRLSDDEIKIVEESVRNTMKEIAPHASSDQIQYAINRTVEEIQLHKDFMKFPDVMLTENIYPKDLLITHEITISQQ